MFERQLTNFTDKVYKDKFEVIKDLTHLDNSKVKDSDGYEKDVVARETIIPTYIGYGIAIPHAISTSVTEPFVIYEKIKNGVAWGDETVNHILMIGVPQEKDSSAKQHLKIISELSKNLMRDNFRNSLLESTDPNEVFELLKSIEKGMEL